jgi:hypothetical protein
MIHVYGIDERLSPIVGRLSDTLNTCVVEALQFPNDKRSHRFFPMPRDCFFTPEGRSDAYLFIEIRMMSGRSAFAKKALVRLLFERIERDIGIMPLDVEICILEAPGENWGFRGLHGDEAKLNYSVRV